MTKNIIGLILVFSGLSTYAKVNPQIRGCSSVGGEFLVVNGDYDQYGICRIGNSIIGAIDILNRDSAIEVPLSLFNYKKGVKVCPTQNLASLSTFEGMILNVCQYSDTSIIDLNTLSNGKDSPLNSELNKALNL